MTTEPLFEGHDTPAPVSTHVLVVDGREDFADFIECSGVHPSCEGWQNCDEEHSAEDEETVGESGIEPYVLHGRPHLAFEEGLTVPTGRCILVEVPDVWVDNYPDDLAPGRYDVTFTFEDERACYLQFPQQPPTQRVEVDTRPVIKAATISEDGLYRYTLSRSWGPGPQALFIMLNPSTADAELDDPTIRRCIGFARREGCDGITVVNLYAYRATKPLHLWEQVDPVGPRNNAVLDAALQQARHAGAPIIAAWGANARAGRVNDLLDIARGTQLHCLGLTKQGAPRHPLYLRSDSQLIPFGVTA